MEKDRGAGHPASRPYPFGFVAAEDSEVELGEKLDEGGVTPIVSHPVRRPIQVIGTEDESLADREAVADIPGPVVGTACVLIGRHHDALHVAVDRVVAGHAD